MSDAIGSLALRLAAYSPRTADDRNDTGMWHGRAVSIDPPTAMLYTVISGREFAEAMNAYNTDGVRYAQATSIYCPRSRNMDTITSSLRFLFPLD